MRLILPKKKKIFSYELKYGFFSKKPLFSAIIVFLVFGTSLTPLYAGIFSFFGKQLIETSYGARSYEKNSQTVMLLTAARNPDPNPSKGGGGVTIVDNSAIFPDIGPEAADADTKVPHSDQISVYVVRDGDSLSEIAKMFGVSVETILWANDIGKGGVIQTGQTLVILPVSGVQHTVKKGDTLSSIAKQYGVHADEIASFNELSRSAVLSVGDEIIVPDGKKSVLPKTAPRIAQTPGISVQSGYFIAPLKTYRKTQGTHGYNGVDLAAPTGSQVLAAASGKVIISRTGWNGGYGNYIVIGHENGTQTVYAHNSQNIVYAGQEVFQGQVIGYVGSTGRSTGSHVHFEVRGARNPF